MTSVERWWNVTDSAKTDVLGEEPVTIPFCPPLIPYRLTLDQTRASTGTPLTCNLQNLKIKWFLVASTKDEKKKKK